MEGIWILVILNHTKLFGYQRVPALQMQTTNLMQYLTSPITGLKCQRYLLILLVHASVMAVPQNCTQKLRYITMFPGAQFNVTMLTVGQRNGFVRGVVIATFRNSSQHHSLGKLQYSQSVDRYCKNLTYNVYSNHTVEYLQLTV